MNNRTWPLDLVVPEPLVMTFRVTVWSLIKLMVTASQLLVPYQLEDSTGTVLRTDLVTDSVGQLRIGNLSAGTYMLVETAARVATKSTRPSTSSRYPQRKQRLTWSQVVWLTNELLRRR
ncbi:SpaA isopeptide-forming pilin-related protein [Lactiplantibacillus plantarum]|nr:SpaA isopeptide-forming pilin-related protein [Lactiplantibacillus plantarum]